MSLLSRAHCSYRPQSRLGRTFVGCVRTERLRDVPRRRYREISLDDWAGRPEPEPFDWPRCPICGCPINVCHRDGCCGLKQSHVTFDAARREAV